MDSGDLVWRTSSFSDGLQCVQVARPDADTVALRNSKQPGAGALTFTRAEMAAWIAGCKAGEFDDLT